MTTTTTKERPIIFTAPMVQAILRGQKTVTRRIVKLTDPTQTYAVHDDDGWPTTMDDCGDWHRDPCPYGQAGDRLWVREKHAWADVMVDRFEREDAQCVAYAADHSCRRVLHDDAWDIDTTNWNWEHPWVKWRSPIHMPRWASRITLEVVSVRVERLQEMTEEEAILEGVAAYRERAGNRINWSSARGAYAALFDRLNGPGSWDLNPWVWRVEFKVCEPARVRDGGGE